MLLKINIAIDGHSSCGKSTIAKAISEKFEMRYIDTGAMYRAITFYCIQNNIIQNKILNYDFLKSELNNIDVTFRYNLKSKISETILNGENVEEEIRGLSVSENVSNISKIKEVRDKLVILQQEMGENKNVVMDGRDIGTKVFPNAEIKFYVTANVMIRAKRRYEELINKGEKLRFKDVLENINLRDKNDSEREINPLSKAKDAILIDNSDISVKEQNENIFKVITNFLDKK
ncbi:MAG: (d)CMP kinase [Flavobacteriales bacterium]|jgi:cytidylate kinase|nr:(d)CMP kinase [Flavobacteriales bacterium]MBT6013374.1 (d)CMP kinase [Flavobacteriales bacterium]MBT7481389.1 (d)CMP kinase [Flavobacteriales bacterium]